MGRVSRARGNTVSVVVALAVLLAACSESGRSSEEAGAPPIANPTWPSADEEGPSPSDREVVELPSDLEVVERREFRVSDSARSSILRVGDVAVELPGGTFASDTIVSIELLRLVGVPEVNEWRLAATEGPVRISASSEPSGEFFITIPVVAAVQNADATLIVTDDVAVAYELHDIEVVGGLARARVDHLSQFDVIDVLAIPAYWMHRAARNRFPGEIHCEGDAVPGWADEILIETNRDFYVLACVFGRDDELRIRIANNRGYLLQIAPPADAELVLPSAEELLAHNRGDVLRAAHDLFAGFLAAGETLKKDDGLLLLPYAAIELRLPRRSATAQQIADSAGKDPWLGKDGLNPRAIYRMEASAEPEGFLTAALGLLHYEIFRTIVSPAGENALAAGLLTAAPILSCLGLFDPSGPVSDEAFESQLRCAQGAIIDAAETASGPLGSYLDQRAGKPVFRSKIRGVGRWNKYRGIATAASYAFDAWAGEKWVVIAFLSAEDVSRTRDLGGGVQVRRTRLPLNHLRPTYGSSIDVGTLIGSPEEIVPEPLRRGANINYEVWRDLEPYGTFQIPNDTRCVEWYRLVEAGFALNVHEFGEGIRFTGDANRALTSAARNGYLAWRNLYNIRGCDLGNPPAYVLQEVVEQDCALPTGFPVRCFSLFTYASHSGGRGPFFSVQHLVFPGERGGCSTPCDVEQMFRFAGIEWEYQWPVTSRIDQVLVRTTGVGLGGFLWPVVASGIVPSEDGIVLWHYRLESDDLFAREVFIPWDVLRAEKRPWPHER